MKILVFLSLVLSFAAASAKTRRTNPVDRSSREAVMTFEGAVEIDAASARSVPAIRERIEKQLRFLFGWMTEGPTPGAPKGDHQLAELRMARKDAGTVWVAYRYSGTVVVRRDQGSYYQVVLPVNPDTAYAASMHGTKNLCADPDFPAPGDFWFAWLPRRPGCPLQAGRDLIVVNARLRTVTQPKTTYPEYERLADAAGNIRIDFLMGMDNPANLRDPNRSRDNNALNFLRVRAGLHAAGWQSRRPGADEIRAVVHEPVKAGDLPYVEELSKLVVQPRTQRMYRLTVRFFYGITEMDEAAVPFHWYLKDALENAAVVVYDGHSGIGEYLDLPEIERRRGFRFSPPQDRYQIYFFNSCNSYAHYNTMFFGRKTSPADPNGTKNLDIITTGLGTYFYSGHESNLALLAAIESWSGGRARLSYQALTPRMDTGNLLGINGDDDNPRR